jgi:hypothetical protein
MAAASVIVNDDLVVRVGRQRASLSPGQAFTLAEQLIRRATRAMIVEELADGSEILAALDNPEPAGHDSRGRQ